MIYIWRCEVCDKPTEVNRPSKDYEQPPERCSTENCWSKKFVRLITAVPFALHGGGWHADLYSKKKEPK